MIMECANCRTREKCQNHKGFCAAWETPYRYIIRDKRTRMYLMEEGDWTTDLDVATHFTQGETYQHITITREVFIHVTS